MRIEPPPSLACASGTVRVPLPQPGADSIPATREEYRAVGKKLKAAGHPIGQTLGHTFGDAPGFTYPYLWSWGGNKVEADGKTVVLNSKGSINSVKFMTDFWKEALDEGGSPGTIPATIAPSSQARSAPP